MAQKDKTTIHFTGFGGQGIVLSSVIFGNAAVLRNGFNAVQTSSYGSEARGGQCQAELILSKETILSPTADEVDILVAMSQMALNSYLERLTEGKSLIIDPDLVELPQRSDLNIYQVPATSVAVDLGLRIAANMVIMGFLQQGTQLMSAEDLFATIAENVPAKFLETNLTATKKGIELAKAMNFWVSK